MDLLRDRLVCSALRQAWLDSQAGNPANRHEEGGYIVRNADGSNGIERWPRGEHSRIIPSAVDANGCYNGMLVVAAFHTHPKPPIDEVGMEWGSKARVHLTDAGTCGADYQVS